MKRALTLTVLFVVLGNVQAAKLKTSDSIPNRLAEVTVGSTASPEQAKFLTASVDCNDVPLVCSKPITVEYCPPVIPECLPTPPDCEPPCITPPDLGGGPPICGSGVITAQGASISNWDCNSTSIYDSDTCVAKKKNFEKSQECLYGARKQCAKNRKTICLDGCIEYYGKSVREAEGAGREADIACEQILTYVCNEIDADPIPPGIIQ